MENVNLSQANQAYLTNQQPSSNPIETKKEIEQIENGDKKINKALAGLAIAGAVIATGIGIYKGVIKPKKAVQQITDVAQDELEELLKENNKLTGKFRKTTKSGAQILMEYNNGVIQKSTKTISDGTQITAEYANGIMKNSTTTKSDGTKIFVEFSDGVLKKSTKTAPDGTKISEKIYSKAPNGDLLVNGKNITEISRQVEKHKNDFEKLMTNQDASLEELQGFDKKNLSKKQIEELDLKIKSKKEAVELEIKKAKEAEELAKKQAQKAKEAQEAVAKEAQEAVAKEAQEAVAKEAQEAVAKLTKENEEKFYELIGKPNVTIDELRKTDINSLTPEQAEILNKKIQILEDTAQAEKAFKDRARKTIPSEEERMKELSELCSSDSKLYKVLEKQYKDENIYLDMLWHGADEYKKLVTKNAIISLSPRDRINFNKAKELFDQNGITYTDADIVNQLGNMHNKAIEGLYDIVDYNEISTAKNTALREGIEPNFECRVLDKAIELSEPLETGQTFYRGVSSVGKVSGSCEELNDAFIDRLINSEIGDIISDKGYSYFSTNADTLEIYANNKGKKNARMIIQVPKGAKVKLGKKALKEGKEGIFPRNAQFRVIEKAKMVNGVPEIVLEYIVP